MRKSVALNILLAGLIGSSALICTLSHADPPAKAQRNSASTCTVCDEFDALRSAHEKFIKEKNLKPDPEDSQTESEQIRIVLETSLAFSKSLKSKLLKEDMVLRAMLRLWGVAAPFDVANRIPEDNFKIFKPHLDRIYKKIDELEKSKVLEKDQAERMKVSLALVEDEN